MLITNSIVSFVDFYVLANRTNNFKIKLQESIFMHHDGPQLIKISESSFDVILLRRIIFVASRYCIALQSPLISDY